MTAQLQPWRAFDREWFRKHQRLLLWLLNSPASRDWFRWVLRIHRDLDPREDVCEIGPSYYKVLLGFDRDRPVLRADFRTHDKFSKRLYFTFAPLWWGMHGWDKIADPLAPALSFGLDSLTRYPDGNPESTTVDGRVWRNSYQSWTLLRNGAGTGASDSEANGILVGMESSNVLNEWYGLYRSIFLFDTSAIGAGATVSAAVLSLRGTAKTDPLLATPNIDIYAATPASNTALVAADYSQIGTVSQTGSPITYAGFSIVGYNDFTFDATGRGNIAVAGVSKFGARNANYDVANVAPTWGNTQLTYLSGYLADQAGTANDPKLVVTYTAGGGKVPLFMNHFRHQRGAA